MSDNYIEIEHEYRSTGESPRGKYVEKSVDVWYATRPSSSLFEYWPETEEEPEYETGKNHNGWAINGSNLSIYTKEDVVGLRKLLDAIEESLVE